SCSLPGPCTPVQIALQTSSLAKGTYTGVITISDPNAIDAPQFVTVTVQIGGTVPDKLEFFVPPGGSASSAFTTASKVTTSTTGQGTLSISGVTATAATGTWLSAASVNNGAAIGVTVDPTGLTPNTYLGTVTVASNAANASVAIPVQLVVVAQSAPLSFVGGA